MAMEDDYEDGREVLDDVINAGNGMRFEGEEGTRNLARLVGKLGYHDKQYFGQFDRGASYGDLIEFFDDNPGAIDAVIEWIYEQMESKRAGDEWYDNLKESAEAGE